MSQNDKSMPHEYTDEEILHMVHALRQHGYGALTLEAYGHKITTIEELNRHRKAPPAGNRPA